MNTLRNAVSLDEQSTPPLATSASRKREFILSRFGHFCLRLGLPIATGLFIVWNLLAIRTLVIDPYLNDFGRFYYSASAFLHGQAMYGPRPAELDQPGSPVGPEFGNLNPPHFHLLLLPVALLSPQYALAFWSMISLLSLIVSLRLIIKESGLELTPLVSRVSILSVLGFAATSLTLGTGQVSFLLLFPITCAWAAARRGQWTGAGALMGLIMSVKPFLLIFLPYFFLRQQRKAGYTALVTIGLGFLLGIWVFGLANHQGWLQTLSEVSWSAINTNTSILGFLTRTLKTTHTSSLAQTLDFIKLLWLGLAGGVGLFTFWVILRDSTTAAVDRHFALLLLAALLISPLGWIYYWWLPVGPFVALVAAWRHEQKKSVSARSGLCCRKIFLFLALPGLIGPFPTAMLLPSHLWARASIGSIYFWTTFFLWASLIADWWAADTTQGRSPKEILGQSAGSPYREIMAPTLATRN